MDITQWIETRYGLQPTDDELRVRAEYPDRPTGWPLDADLEDYRTAFHAWIREAEIRLVVRVVAEHVRARLRETYPAASVEHVFPEHELVAFLDEEMAERVKAKPVTMPDVPLTEILSAELG